MYHPVRVRLCINSGAPNQTFGDISYRAAMVHPINHTTDFRHDFRTDPVSGRNRIFCLQPLSFSIYKNWGRSRQMTKVEPPCVFFEGEDLILFL